MPGCPGIPTTASGGDMIGVVPITPGYAYPTLSMASGPSYTNMLTYHNEAYDNSGSVLNSALEGVGGSCSCCCSEMMTGPTFMHQYNDCDEDYCCGMMTGWADRDYWPGGSSGLYMDLMSGKMYHFNVGQYKQCEEIRGGLYSFTSADDVDCEWDRYEWSLSSGWHWSHKSTHDGKCGKAWGFQQPALAKALFNYSPTQCYYHSAGASSGKWRICAQGNNPTGGFKYISLCLPCMAIDDSTCIASCANAQHWGKNNPSVAPSPPPGGGPGYSHNVPYVGSLFEAQNCATDPCSPNGLCFGPGPATGPGPTGCFSNNSPLDGSGGFATPDNVCFDCEAKSIFHPCYDPANPQTANNGGGPNGNTGGGGSSRSCSNIHSPGIDIDGIPIPTADAYWPPKSLPGLWADDYGVVQDENQWDVCCTYDVIGCVDSTFANFNPLARNGGYDCKGNPDPNVAYTYYDGGCSCIMCQNVPTLPVGINTHPDLVDQNGAVINFDNPAPGPGVACTTLQGSNFAPIHPLGWSNTSAKFSDIDCCTNAGCMDSGAGGIPWDNRPFKSISMAWTRSVLSRLYYSNWKSTNTSYINTNTNSCWKL